MKKTYLQPTIISTNISLTGVICAGSGEITPESNPTPGGQESVCGRKLYA